MMLHPTFLLLFLFVASLNTVIGPRALGTDYFEARPFGDSARARSCDTVATGEWWQPNPADSARKREMREWIVARPRDQVLAFAVYTHDDGVLKLTVQSFPLYPDEPKTVSLALQRNGSWEQVARQPLRYPGWSAHFRIEDWDASEAVPYRASLGELSVFEGLIRPDPTDQDTIVVASMSCNSPRDKTRYERTELVENLKQHDPDLLFFAGDQSYLHEEHTYGWLQTGVQFAGIMRDRPTITIPDDHDVGQGNLWGEGGRVTDVDNKGGYVFPADYVKMVERCQTWHLPDPHDPTPVAQGIGVYYTNLVLGGIDFAILEDRKFKSGPGGRIPEMGPRPDHIVDPSYDRAAIDLPGLKLLGDRQLDFLDTWVQDWTGAEMKVVLSQTAFAGAVHLHGTMDNRLLADLDCNGWPQTGRNRALRVMRQARATHLCGDQHLAVVVKHGIDAFRDGPMAFTNPALVNTIYGRWWWPEDEKAGGGDPVATGLPWTGDYRDGLGNRITMYAYANPDHDRDELKGDLFRDNRGDGYGLVRFNRASGDVVFECWPRFAHLSRGDAAQFAGWPMRFNVAENDGRVPVGRLPEVQLPVENAVVAVINEATGERLYCHRVKGSVFRAPVFSQDRFTVRAGADRPTETLLRGAVIE